jgi:hypothetical protein
VHSTAVPFSLFSPSPHSPTDGRHCDPSFNVCLGNLLQMPCFLLNQDQFYEFFVYDIL